MKAIKIDSHNHIIQEVEINNLQDMQNAVEGNIEVAHELVHKNQWNTVYCNEEGLSDERDDWFIWKEAHQPFKGNGLVLGVDPKTGNSQSTNLTAKDVKQFVTFADSFIIKTLLTSKN